MIFSYRGKAGKWKDHLSDEGLEAFAVLKQDLKETGGTLHGRYWASFGRLHQLKNKPYHCHLRYDEVAVWELQSIGGKLYCAFIYIGSRKDAPY